LGRKITIESGSYTYTGTAVDFNKLCPKQNSDSTLGTASTTTLVAISDVMCVSTSSSGALSFSGDLTYVPQTMTNGVYSAYLLWRYRSIGGSFIDVGTETLATVFAEVEGGGLAITGEISASATLSGLSPNTNYEVQLYARRGSPPSNTLEFSGTATVEAVVKIVIGSGAYSYTGTSVDLEYNRKITIDSGSYTYTGTAVTLKVGKVIGIDSGSYSYTGTAVNFSLVKKITIDSGSYSYTGTAVTLARGRSIVIDSGSYAYTGTAVDLEFGRKIAIDSGSYSYTGTAVNFVASRILTIGSGSYTYTGTAVNLVTSRILTIGSGSYSYTGTDVDFSITIARTISIDSGSYTYTGSAVNLVYVSFVSNVYLGTTNIQTAYIGSAPITKIYKGTTQVFG
jgi:Uri superfamily endonuclease